MKPAFNNIQNLMKMSTDCRMTMVMCCRLHKHQSLLYA
jgi:hypothetical protein